VVASLNDAVTSGDVIVNAMPGEVTLTVLKSLDSGALDGKVLIDPTTAVTERYELLYPNSSLAERLQEAFPTLHVVKTLNTMSAPVMADPGVLPAPTTVFLSGNDAEAKRVVADLLVDLGWPTASHFDLGDVTTARGTEHCLLLFMGIFQATGTDEFGITLVQSPQAPNEDRR
jgi:predicted dinucleotide-binding enzyme